MSRFQGFLPVDFPLMLRHSLDKAPGRKPKVDFLSVSLLDLIKEMAGEADTLEKKGERR